MRCVRLGPHARRGPPPGRPSEPRERVLVGSVITLAMFWELSSYAGVVGRGYAERIARSVGSLPQVIVTSPDPLGVLAPGVTEEAVSVPGPAGTHNVRYRTAGSSAAGQLGRPGVPAHRGLATRTGSGRGAARQRHAALAAEPLSRLSRRSQRNIAVFCCSASAYC